MKQLSELISRHEDWLVNRTIHYAKRHGYTAFTSTLSEAWRVAVCGLSEPLIKALALYDERFCRMWEFYLCACSISFDIGGDMVFQLLLGQHKSAVPVIRDYIADDEKALEARGV